MSQTFQADYQSIGDMDHGAAPVSWKKFFVILAGRTNGAHKDLVNQLKAVGQTEVQSAEASDYRLVFCPIVSRVGTDISEALDNIPGGKPVILVVMHHTFNPDHVVAESRLLVNSDNVRLTVDSLFHQGNFLKSRRNEIALYEVKTFLRARTSQGSCPRLWIPILAVTLIMAVILLIVLLLLTVKL